LVVPRGWANLQYRTLWAARFDALENYLNGMQQKNKKKGKLK